jgi:hypothetical protein
VSLADVGGSKTTTSCKVLIFAGVAGGTFVIGDRNAAIGTAVIFWGAEWWKSAGSGPRRNRNGGRDRVLGNTGS